MEKLNLNRVKSIRRRVLEKFKDQDSVYFEGRKNILLSAPHGVAQTRLGKHKDAELGTIPTGWILAEKTKCHLLIKTQNNFDDANFDENCEYRKRLAQIIKEKNIKYLIDIHGLAKKRNMDINIGTNFGNNVKNNPMLFEHLLSVLKKDFVVEVDQPFMGSGKTISGYFSSEFNIWSVQLEINCAITNYISGMPKFEKLLDLLEKWIKDIEQFES